MNQDNAIIIAAIIAASGAIIAAAITKSKSINKGKRKKIISTYGHPIENYGVFSGGDLTVGRDINITNTLDKNNIGQKEKDLFALGFGLGAIPFSLSVPLPNETFYHQERQTVIYNFLKKVEYPKSKKLIDSLSKILREKEASKNKPFDINESRSYIQKLSELFIPLNQYIEINYKGIGNISYILGLNIPPLLRTLFLLKHLDDNSVKQQYRTISSILSDHIEKFRQLVLSGVFSDGLNSAINYVATADFTQRENRLKMTAELSKIGSFFNLPIMPDPKPNVDSKPEKKSSKLIKPNDKNTVEFAGLKLNKNDFEGIINNLKKKNK